MSSSSLFRLIVNLIENFNRGIDNPTHQNLHIENKIRNSTLWKILFDDLFGCFIGSDKDEGRLSISRQQFDFENPYIERNIQWIFEIAIFAMHTESTTAINT